MKNYFIYAMLIIFLFASCKGKVEDVNANDEEEQQEETTSINEFPWDFPQSIELELTEGQYVLSPISFYHAKIKAEEELENGTYIFYSDKLTEVGETKSFIKDRSIPNSLIIPIPMEQTAQKGDIVLTWWQGGSGMQRAIVINDDNPAEPFVDFLDLSYDEDFSDSKNAYGKHATKLLPNSFVVLEEGKWQSGMPFVYKDEFGSWVYATIVNIADDNILAKGFAGSIFTCKKSNSKLLKLKPDFKKGEEVKAVFVSKFADNYTVVNYNKHIGRVWVRDNNDNVKAHNIFEVSKDL
ncbi:MAG: hypothetical protein GX879_03415 [Bacteroidales bacterium]|nr:hypothetical protein [Bacteroidales bacterium]